MLSRHRLDVSARRKLSCLCREKNGKRLARISITVRVRTHQQSRVESNPVQSDSQRRDSDSLAYFQWPPRQCVHTSRVESSPSHESCRVKRLDAACSTFVSQTLVIGRDGCCIEEEMDVKFVLFHDFRNKSAILVTLHEFLIVN